MALGMERLDMELIPVEELLAELLDVSGARLRPMVEAIAALVESVKTDSPPTAVIRSRLYDILDRVEADLPDHATSLGNWATVRTGLIRTVFASQRNGTGKCLAG